MKSKKKMLLALGAMSAAAIGAGATSTFAWFTVTTTAKVMKTVTAETVSLSGTSAKTSYLKWTVTPDPTSVNLDLTDNNGKMWYWNTATGGAVEYTTPAAAKAAAITYGASVALDNSKQHGTTFTEAYKQMYDQYPNIFLKIVGGADMRIDTAHDTVGAHVYTTAVNQTYYISLAEDGSIAADATGKSYSQAMTVSIKGHETQEDYASRATDYAGATVTVDIGYGNKADPSAQGFVFTEFGDDYPA